MRGATFTLPGKIFLPGTCADFYGNPWLVLHEYYYVVDQWHTGRMTLGGYLTEGAGQWLGGNDPHGDNRFENEADFFAAPTVTTSRTASAAQPPPVPRRRRPRQVLACLG